MTRPLPRPFRFTRTVDRVFAGSLAAGLLLLPVLSAAQRRGGPPGVPAAPVPTGAVSGRVLCADTQRPARFAEVSLLRKPDATDQGGDANGRGSNFSAMGNGRTTLDGSFVITSVPVGDYYVIARVAGYIVPGGSGASGSAADMDSVMSGVPQVHVDAGRESRADLTLQRGASVSGRVLFDDGSPASGVTVQIRSADAADQLSPVRFMGLTQGMRFAQTDDRGMYRLSGVGPGKYNVVAMITAGGGSRFIGTVRGTTVGDRPASPVSVLVYAPGKFHAADARVLDIRAAEEVSDTDIVANLVGLHSVRGSVLSAADRHALSGGSVSLLDQTDKGFQRHVQIESDGGFHFDYLPAGSYTVSVGGAADVTASHDPARPWAVETSKRYGQVGTSVVVGEHDMALDALLAPELKDVAGPAQH
jgi:hypothetical protein